MTIFTEGSRQWRQQLLDDIYGDDVTLKLHTRHPGHIDHTRYLAYGDGLPQPHKFSNGQLVAFQIPDHIHDVRPAWKRWITRKPQTVTIEAVSLWRDGKPLDVTPITPITRLHPGDIIKVDVPKPGIR